MPLARVLAQRPPRELPEERGNGAYEHLGQAICVRQTDEGFSVRVAGPLAVRHSPEQGVKTLVAATESLARRAAESWVDRRNDEGQGDCEGEELEGLRYCPEAVS